jgi:hypothetical protein
MTCGTDECAFTIQGQAVRCCLSQTSSCAQVVVTQRCLCSELPPGWLTMSPGMAVHICCYDKHLGRPLLTCSIRLPYTEFFLCLHEHMPNAAGGTAATTPYCSLQQHHIHSSCLPALLQISHTLMSSACPPGWRGVARCWPRMHHPSGNLRLAKKRVAPRSLDARLQSAS